MTTCVCGEKWAVCSPPDPPPPPTLHDPEATFDLDYNAPKIRPYDLSKGFLIITANMGAGKTEAAFEAIKDLPDTTNILIITCSIALSRQCLASYRGCDFHLYLDDAPPRAIDDGPEEEEEGPSAVTKKHRQYMLKHNRIICCIDSLHRIDLERFDIVILDEVFSLLQRFHTDMMRRKFEVCGAFRRLMLHSSTLLLMDANADNQLVRRFVAQLHKERSALSPSTPPPYWVRNRFVRINQDPVFGHVGPEKITIHVNHTKSLTKHTFDMGIAHLHKLLLDNKRVVVACSSKSVVKKIEKSIVGLGVKAAFYTSEKKCKAMLEAHMQDVNTHWFNYSLVVYSPTITSGISFTQLHFDVRMAFLENSLNTAPVDVCLQQMYRVRPTRGKEAFIYLNDAPSFSRSEVSMSASGVERILDVQDRYLSLLNAHASDGCTRALGPTGRLVYERDNLFYPILVGTLVNRGQSLHQFTPILVSALANDRGAEVTISPVAEPKQKKAAADSASKEEPTIRSFKVPTAKRVAELRASEYEGPDLSEEDQQQLLNYSVVSAYGIAPAHADVAFISGHVGAVSKRNALDKATLTLDGFSAFKLLIQTQTLDGLARNSGEMLQQGRDTDKSGLRIMEFFADRSKEFHIRVLEASDLLAALFPSKKLLPKLFKGPKHEFKDASGDVYARLEAYLKALPADRYKMIIKVFEFDASMYKAQPTGKQRSAFIRKILGAAFQLHVTVPYADVVVSAQPFYDLLKKYQPQVLKIDEDQNELV